MKETGLHVNASVRRKLLAGSLAYLAGIYFTKLVFFPTVIVLCVCALFLCMGLYCLMHRKSALIYILAAVFVFGNFRAGSELLKRDEATAPGSLITGTVIQIESDKRVYLDNVCINGEGTLLRPAAVTLMAEEDENGNPVVIPFEIQVGQTIQGTGRLFEQEGKRNPGGTDWRINALSDGYDLSGYILPGFTVTGQGRFSVKDLFRKLRNLLSERIDVLFGQHAPLYKAILIGDRTGLDGDTVQAMRMMGIAHILTISGMHMSLIAHALQGLMARFNMRRRIRFVLQTVLLGAFACLTGFAVGTIRACIMAIIRELAAMTGRRYDSLTSLGTAALVMTLIRPVWALSVSFQFSFFVVLGILLLNKQLFSSAKRAKRYPDSARRAAQLASLTFSAQLAAMPMQLLYYGYIPILAMPMNLLCGVCLPVMMLGGWTVVAASEVLPATVGAAASLLGCFSSMLGNVCAAAAKIPWGIVRLPAPYEGTIIIALAFLFLVSKQVYVRAKRRRMALVLLASLILLYLPRFDPALRYVQLDVGQGDSAIIRKNRQAILLDVGPENEYAALHYLRHEGLFVDAVILSHADEDHAGALQTLLDSEVTFDRIVMPVGALEDMSSQAVADAMTKAQEKAVSFEFYEKGDKVTAGGFAFSVLSPDADMKGSNERSLVLYADLEGMRLLTLGDLPQKCEMDKVPGCDILKVAHHGSRYATSRELLEQARPKIAIISVGRNSYGHPADRVILDLNDIGARIFRTDQNGCITIWLDNQELNKMAAYVTP